MQARNAGMTQTAVSGGHLNLAAIMGRGKRSASTVLPDYVPADYIFDYGLSKSRDLSITGCVGMVGKCSGSRTASLTQNRQGGHMGPRTCGNNCSNCFNENVVL